MYVYFFLKKTKFTVVVHKPKSTSKLQEVNLQHALCPCGCLYAEIQPYRVKQTLICDKRGMSYLFLY